MNIFSKLAITAGMSLLLAAGVAQAQSKTFNVWWFELPDTSQAKAWTKALEELKAKHPDVTINFEQKTFEQLQRLAASSSIRIRRRMCLNTTRVMPLQVSLPRRGC